MTIRPELLDELLKDYQTPQDLFGDNGILKQLTKGMIERRLQAEMGMGTPTLLENTNPLLKALSDFKVDSHR
jgi:hypothetical protein